MLRHLKQAGRVVRLARDHRGEAWLASRLAFSVAAFTVLIKLLPLPRALSLLSPGTRNPAPREQTVSEERLAQLLDSVLGLNFLCFTPICWKRAAVLHRQLALRGRDTRVIFGLRKDGGDLLAGHAWIESDGQPLFETTAPTYAVTYSFPPEPSQAAARS
ncbi:MAG: lasso peptide biosynthesis B2 protein [Pyrinomonadaceae bacterium]